MRPTGTLLILATLAVLAASCAGDAEPAPKGDAAAPATTASEAPAGTPQAKTPAELPRVNYYVISQA